MKKIVFIFCSLFISSLLLAYNACAEKKVEECKNENTKTDYNRRFTSYEKNYGIWQYTQHDEAAMEVQYSLKYNMYDCNLSSKQLFGCKNDDTTRLTVFFSYTGNFDFYLATRPSNPVINRKNNPAIHIMYEFNKKDNSSNWIDISAEHRSNGQIFGVHKKDNDINSPNFGKYLTEIEYDKKNHEYFDRISRGSNYVNLSTGWAYSESGKIDLGYKIYLSNNSDITWGKYAGLDTKFNDFDLVRVKFSDKILKNAINIFDITFGLEYTIGTKTFKTDSIDLYLISQLNSERNGWQLPAMLKVHMGPMDRLSNYSEPLKSIGFGVAFSY